MSSTVIVTVELGIESPEAGITLLPVGDDLDLPLIVHGFGTVTGTLLTLDGQSIPVGTTSLTSTLLGSLGLSTFGPHQLSVSADDAAGNAHSASVSFEVILTGGPDVWEVKPESVKPNSELVTGFFTLPNSPTSNPNDPTYLDVVHSTITVEGLKVATPESVEVNNDRGELIINVRRDDLTDANGEIGTEFTLKLRFFSSAGPQFQATDDVGPPGGRGLPPVSCAVSSHGRQGTVLRSVPVALLLAGLWLGFYRFRRHRG